MSKEYLEALDRMSFHRFDEQYEEWDSDYATVENYLESIDNAKPSEALECLERFFNSRKIYEPNNTFVFDCITCLNSIKQALLKAQEQEKVLEIIFKKEVSIFQLKCCKNVNEYNDLQFKKDKKLTEEEFDLLKRWLG